MGLVLVSALALPDWSGGSVARPMWMMCLPMIFGIAGAVMAWRKNSLAGVLISAVLGFAALPVLYVVTVLLEGA